MRSADTQPQTIDAGAEPSRPPVVIRPLTTVAEFARCVELQREVWRWSDLDLTPVRVFVLMHHAGGLVLGAVDAREIIGFVNCIPAHRKGRSFWQSHLMAVRPSCQNRGLGTALKMAQRQHAIARGIHEIQWAFDPLLARNAYLYIVKLGAIVRQYSVNHYGTTSSPLDTGQESDRLIAEWHGGDLPVRYGIETRIITIPADVQSLRAIDPEAVRPLQLAVRAEFMRHLADGFVATGFRRGPGIGEYVMRRPLDAADAKAEGA